MIDLELARQILLILVGLVFLLLALRTLLSPDAVAAEVGYTLQGANGYSELHAIYCGLWLAHAGLAGFAAWQVGTPIYGDLLALLILAQPLGRILALRHGRPTGALAGFFWLEVIGGGCLLLVRP